MISPFGLLTTKTLGLIKHKMPPKQSARIQLHITVNHEHDNTLQAVELAADTTPQMFLSKATIKGDVKFVFNLMDKLNNEQFIDLDYALDNDLNNNFDHILNQTFTVISTRFFTITSTLTLTITLTILFIMTLSMAPAITASLTQTMTSTIISTTTNTMTSTMTLTVTSSPTSILIYTVTSTMPMNMSLMITSTRMPTITLTNASTMPSTMTMTKTTTVNLTLISTLSLTMTWTTTSAITSTMTLTMTSSILENSKVVWQPCPILADTPVSLTSALKYFQMSQTPLELSKVLTDSARAGSGAPASTCRYGGAFRMLQNLTYRMVKFWSSWGICAALWETSREAENHVQLCGIRGAIFTRQWLFVFHNHQAFRLSYLSLLALQICHIIIWHILCIKISLCIHIQWI